MRPAAVVLTLFALSVAPALPAQQMPFAPGARIRYRFAGSAERQQGTLLERTADSIVVGWPDAAPQRIALASITSVEVGHGRSHLRGAGQGALWGAAIGVGCVAAAYASSNDGTTRSSVSLGEWSAIGALVGVVYGAPIGFLVGSERWDRVPMRPDRVGIRPTPHGMGLALSWSR